MKEPLPEWGPAERDARLRLNCMRYELPHDIAQDIIDGVLAAFAELRGGPPLEPSLEARQQILAVIAQQGCYCDTDDECLGTCIGAQIEKILSDGLRAVPSQESTPPHTERKWTFAGNCPACDAGCCGVHGP